MGTGVYQRQQRFFADGCAALLSTPPTALPNTYRHFVATMTTSREAFFIPSCTLDTFLGVVFSGARVLHDLVRAYPRWWLSTLVVRKVVAVRKAVRQACEVVVLERSFEVVRIALPHGGLGPLS